MNAPDTQRIRQIVDEVKPSYTQYGGDVEFVDVVDNKVRIRTTGYCHT